MISGKFWNIIEKEMIKEDENVNAGHKDGKLLRSRSPRYQLPSSENVSRSVNNKNSNATKEHYLKNFNFPHCENVSKFVDIVKIGQGTYGWVKSII